MVMTAWCSMLLHGLVPFAMATFIVAVADLAVMSCRNLSITTNVGPVSAFSGATAGVWALSSLVLTFSKNVVLAAAELPDLEAAKTSDVPQRRVRPLLTGRVMSPAELSRVVPEQHIFASTDDIQKGCLSASLAVAADENEPPWTLERFRDVAIGFYASGAPLLVYQGLVAAILRQRREVAAICPPAVLQALVLRIEALLLQIYTGSSQSRNQHLASFNEASLLHSEFVALQRWLSEIPGFESTDEHGWPLARGLGRVQRYYDMLWDDVHNSEDTWEVMERPGEISDELYHAALDDVASVLGDLRVEWWPCRGTLIALLRHGQRSGMLSRGLRDVPERDIDVMLGVDDEAAWQDLAPVIEQRLQALGWDRCWTKTSVDSSSALRDAARRDLLYCIRQSPAYMLLDVTSYLNLPSSPSLFVHRICGSGNGNSNNSSSSFTAEHVVAGRGCAVPGGIGPLQAAAGILSKSSVLPLGRCRAGNISVPCPRRPLDTILAMVHSGLDASCIALPTAHGRDPEDVWTQRLRESLLNADDVHILRRRSEQLEAAGFLSMAPYFEICSTMAKVMENN